MKNKKKIMWLSRDPSNFTWIWNY